MADIQDALAMEGGIQKDMLIGRWAASPANGARTHVVLTFPAGGGPTTPVRIHVTDQDGLSGSRDFMLGLAVNLCTFMTTDGATTLSCNAGSPLPLSSMGGWFKIVAPDMMGFPVIGMISTVYDGANGNFDQTAPIQWMEMDMRWRRQRNNTTLFQSSALHTQLTRTEGDLSPAKKGDGFYRLPFSCVPRVWGRCRVDWRARYAPKGEKSGFTQKKSLRSETQNRFCGNKTKIG